VTVLEVIQRSTAFLEGKGVDSPRLQAELLLAHVLKMARMRLYLNFERAMSEAETAQSRELVKRRGQREPLQQILGSTSFCGCQISLNKHTLIPRPETEILAEAGWQFLQSRMALESLQPVALDFGTGSGCIAIALALKAPTAKVFASENSPEALTLARQNCAAHELADRIQLLEGDGFILAGSLPPLNLIISNPPYIPRKEIETLQIEVRDFEPHSALDGGEDGLDYFRRFAGEAAAWLRPGGKIMLEFGDGQGPVLEQMFQAQNWVVEPLVADYTGRPRILVAKTGELRH
jgi:release factor glutamine methyltransferase